MTEETDIKQGKDWLNENHVQKVIESLRKKQMNGQYVPNRHEALEVVMDMIPPGAVVSRGGSLSAEQVGVIAEIQKRNLNKIVNPHNIPPCLVLRIQKWEHRALVVFIFILCYF